MSEGESDLELEHPRWIDIGERRKRIRCRSHAHELTESRIHDNGVAVRCLGSPEEVAVIEEIEPLGSQ
jgi:hypothetical protein